MGSMIVAILLSAVIVVVGLAILYPKQAAAFLQAAVDEID